MPAEDLRPSIEAVWRIESGRIVASLARLVRDLGRAEELAQDAFVAALERLGRGAEARSEFERAAAMTANDRERELLLARAGRGRRRRRVDRDPDRNVTDSSGSPAARSGYA